MELKEEIAAIEGLSPELVEKLVPFVQGHKDTSFTAGVGKAYQEVEEKTKSLFGIEKDEKEKATSFIERSVSLYKKGLENDFMRTHLDPTKKELEALKEKLGKGITDEKLKQEFEDLKQTHSKVSTEFEEYKKLTEKEKSDLVRDWQIKSELKGVKFANKDADYVKFKTESFINSIKKEFEIVETDKGLLFKGGKDHGYKDFTLPELIEKGLGDLIEKDNNSGTGNGNSSVNSGALSVVISGAKSKGEAFEMIKKSLITEGLTITSPDWSAKFTERLKQYEKELSKLS